jgi:hypothetical protein
MLPTLSVFLLEKANNQIIKKKKVYLPANSDFEA